MGPSRRSHRVPGSKKGGRSTASPLFSFTMEPKLHDAARASPFLSRASWSIVLSKVKSATKSLSLRFSSRSCRSSRSSETPSPRTSFQRKYVASLIPSFRQYPRPACPPHHAEAPSRSALPSNDSSSSARPPGPLQGPIERAGNYPDSETRAGSGFGEEALHQSDQQFLPVDHRPTHAVPLPMRDGRGSSRAVCPGTEEMVRRRSLGRAHGLPLVFGHHSSGPSLGSVGSAR